MKLFKDDETLDQRTDELLETAIDPATQGGDVSVTQIVQTDPKDMTTLDIAFELAHVLRGYQPMKNEVKIEKRLKSLTMMREYYEKRVAACTEEEQGLKIVFQHYLNAIKLSYANITQMQKMMRTVKPLVDELNQRRVDHGN